MKERSLYAVLTLALLALMIGPVAAHAQASPTATPTPGSCALTLPAPDPSSTPIAPDCGTGLNTLPSSLGVSGGNYNSVSIDPKTGAVGCYTGTMGAVVQDASANEYVLGSSHGLARNGGKGVKTNEPVVQPGLPDVGCWQAKEDTVAQLSKWSTLNFKGGKNELDAAIAKVVMTSVTPVGPLVPGVDPNGNIQNIGQISTTPFPYDSLQDGLEVTKMGRGSCLTGGFITAWDAMGVVTYPNTDNPGGSGIAYFDHQVLVLGQTFSNPATLCSFASNSDSGALVLTYNPNFQCLQAIGVIFAGSSGNSADSGGTIVAVNPIQAPTPNPLGIVGVLDKFKVSLVGDSVCTPASPIFSEQAPTSSPEISTALRASIERVRKVKEVNGRRLLRKVHEVTAIGIAKGDAPDTAVLNVYLSDDTPETRAKVLKELHHNSRVRFKNAAKFQAL